MLTGLGFPESLRWRDDALWFSDMFRGKVMRWVPGSDPVVVLDAERGGPNVPGGLGWLPNGDLLVVDCERRLVLRASDDQVAVHADLSDLVTPAANDMHVDSDGWAWVGGYGFTPGSEDPRVSRLVRVSPSGDIDAWGPDLLFPNGCERRADGALVVAETFADRVSLISRDGHRLSAVSLAAGSGPDGLSIAPDGDVFVALAFTGAVVRMGPSGNSRTVYAAPPIMQGPGAGPVGCYDCAAHRDGKVVAIATASINEDLAVRVNTGGILLLRT